MDLQFPVFKLTTDLKDEFLILAYGTHRTFDQKTSFEFNAEDAKVVIAAFKRRGLDMLNDWEHQSIAHLPGFEHFKSPDGRAPAAGWNGDLEARTDGLWATKVRWTPDAVTAIKSGTYRYYSPVLAIGKDGHVKMIQSVGLTNEPALENIPALAARADLSEIIHSLEGENIMAFKTELAEALGIAATSDDAAILAEVRRAKQLASGLEAQLTALKSKPSEETGELKEALAGIVESYALDTGRISPAQQKSWTTLIKRDPLVALTALKSIEIGAAVPVGRMAHEQVNVSAGISDGDLTLAMKNAGVDPLRLALHEAARTYQHAHPGISYVDALAEVSRK